MKACAQPRISHQVWKCGQDYPCNSKLRAVYRFLTDDSSANDNAISKALDIRMAVPINPEDPDLALDLREMNDGRPEKYEVFWEALGSYLVEHTAAQERRHGDAGYMPVAI